MRIFSLTLIFFSICFFANSQILPDTSAIIKHIRYFSSPVLQGRLPGTSGYNQASEYAVSVFKQLKIKGIKEEEYCQPFPIESNVIKKAKVQIIEKDKTIPLRIGSDFSCRGFTGSGKIKAEVVFCGYGQSHPDYGYDDYGNVDVKGKIVMVYKQSPTWNINGLTWGGSSIRYKEQLAKSKGAKGIIFINTPSSKRTQPIASMMDGPEKHLNDFPAIEFSYTLAEEIFNKEGFKQELIQSKIDTLQIPQSFNSKTEVFIEIEAEYNENAQTQNIVAIIPGNHPELKNEYVVLGAHLDHVGFQGDSLYYPGANDNASGSAVLLEVARMLKKSKFKSERTLVLVLFSCEEHGLDGAKFFVENFAGIDKTMAMLNMDCVGYNDSLIVGGGEASPELYKIATQDKNNEKISARTWYGGGADAQPFFDIEIPTLYFATLNSYTFLHLPGDKPETLNRETLALTAKTVFKTITYISSGKYTKETIIQKK